MTQRFKPTAIRSVAETGRLSQILTRSSCAHAVRPCRSLTVAQIPSSVCRSLLSEFVAASRRRGRCRARESPRRASLGGGSGGGVSAVVDGRRAGAATGRGQTLCAQPLDSGAPLTVDALHLEERVAQEREPSRDMAIAGVLQRDRKWRRSRRPRRRARPRRARWSWRRRRRPRAGGRFQSPDWRRPGAREPAV